jgi:hypothetical protein
MPGRQLLVWLAASAEVDLVEELKGPCPEGDQGPYFEAGTFPMVVWYGKRSVHIGLPGCVFDDRERTTDGGDVGQMTSSP